jgi:hypothetical protein
LLLNVSRQVVYSIAGPAEPLPQFYSFGCDPAVFVGTSDD